MLMVLFARTYQKEWSPERRQMIAEAMGDAILEQQGLLDKLRN